MSREKITKLHFVTLTFLRKLTKPINVDFVSVINGVINHKITSTLSPAKARDLNAYLELLVPAARKRFVSWQWILFKMVSTQSPIQNLRVYNRNFRALSICEEAITVLKSFVLRSQNVTYGVFPISDSTSLPLTWRDRVRSPVGSVFPVEIFRGFSLYCKTNVRKTYIHPRTSLVIVIMKIFHYERQWSLMLTRPKPSFAGVKNSVEYFERW